MSQIKFKWYKSKRTDLAPLEIHILPSLWYWKDSKCYKNPMQTIVIGWLIWSLSIKWGESAVLKRCDGR